MDKYDNIVPKGARMADTGFAWSRVEHHGGRNCVTVPTIGKSSAFTVLNSFSSGNLCAEIVVHTSSVEQR